MSRIKESRDRPKGTAGLTRRQFLTYSAAAGVLAGSSPLIAAQDKRRSGHPPHGSLNHRTLFFNFSHEPDAAKARYLLVAAGRRYPLRRVRKGSAVLRRARRRNLFLRQLPDSALTHVVENVFFNADVVHLCYVIKNPDRTTGTWSMSSMFFQPPASSVLNAFELCVDCCGLESLPVSAKRQLYRLGPATTPSDLLEEEALKDPTDHATAIIGVHPELLSADPDSAAIIQKCCIGKSIHTLQLSMELQRLGPATPQLMPNQPNSSGWATLTPVADENGQPFKNQKGNNQGLIQYHPAWNPGIAANGGSQGVHSVLNQVKNDPKLGADVTGLDPNAPNTNLTGRVWQRHDGFTTVDQSPMAGDAVEDSVKFTLTTQNTESGYSCKGTASAQSDGTVQATLTFTNWYVRWLGIYLLFLDANGKPLDASGVKVTTPPDYDPKEDRGKLASEKALFAMLLGPEFTVLGVPVAHSTATVTFNLPEAVSSVRVFASGPNFLVNTAPDPNDPSTWGDPLPGWLVTALVNYGVTMLLMGAGATDALSAIQKAALPLAASIVVDVIDLIGDAFRNKDFGHANAWEQVALATLKALLTSFTGRAVAVLALITVAIAEGEAEDAIPIAGQIAQAVSLVAGAATILETTIEIAESPISYAYDLVLTHDLSVTIHPDPKNKVFPRVANYYKVTALFDNGGTPHVQTLDMPGDTVSTLPPVVFRNVPLGGKVNVSVGFYSRSRDRTQNDWLAGKGTTGLVDNTVGQKPEITIEQFPVPIRSNTIYEHKQKTALDAQDNHLWVTAPAPTVKQSDISCGGAGTLCAFRDITVRQGTSVPSAPGYVGYAWQGFSSGVVGCASRGQGQLDQLANLGVVDAQSGYVTAPCGLETGAQLTYSLLTRGTSNFYLDSTNNVVRQVQLDPTPKFDNPTNMQQAWGALNLASDALLLHPSGRLVSINNANSKIEVLKIPDAPVTVEEAKMKLLANVFSGQGSRPGLIDAPSAAAVSPEGVTLVLEDNNSRLQAFDLGGNPVQFFKNQELPYFLSLEATAGEDTVYLDLAVEFTGYLYVLSFNQGTNLYRLDIYHPDQTDTNPISTTQNVNAAKLTVDFWRNVYTLNYEVLKLPDEKVPSFTEPSVSLWVPSTP